MADSFVQGARSLPPLGNAGFWGVTNSSLDPSAGWPLGLSDIIRCPSVTAPFVLSICMAQLLGGVCGHSAAGRCC